MKTRTIHGLMLAATASFLSVGSAQIPAEWRPDDLGARSQWFGVEVSRFPSRMLASGVEDSLRSFGWGPVKIVEHPNGEASVVLGEVTNPADAYYLAEELRIQNVAQGKVVALPVEPRAPLGYTGESLLPAFAPSQETGPGKTLSANDAHTRIESEEPQFDSTRKAVAQDFLKAWGDGDEKNPVVGRGALSVCDYFLEKQTEPELILYLAGRVARGQWGATPDEKSRAAQITSELLYGYRRDWRGAWRAAKAIEASAVTTDAKALARLRQAALMVELIERRIDPGPTFAEIRSELRVAHEGIDPAAENTEQRVELVYVETFAWEGNWSRVEELSRAFLKDHPKETASRALVKILLAQSLERTQQIDEAKKLLIEVIGTGDFAGDPIRLGMETLDVKRLANEKLRYFNQMTEGLMDPAAKPKANEDLKDNEEKDAKDNKPKSGDSAKDSEKLR
ncbi:hypothetical protein BH09SUM1_BH09SUM1_07650 [soil metagenome]